MIFHSVWIFKTFCSGNNKCLSSLRLFRKEFEWRSEGWKGTIFVYGSRVGPVWGQHQINIEKREKNVIFMDIVWVQAGSWINMIKEGIYWIMLNYVKLCEIRKFHSLWYFISKPIYMWVENFETRRPDDSGSRFSQSSLRSNFALKKTQLIANFEKMLNETCLTNK